MRLVIADNSLSPVRRELKAVLPSGKFHSTCSVSDENDHSTDRLLMLMGCIRRDSYVSCNTLPTFPENVSLEPPLPPSLGWAHQGAHFQ